MTGSEKPDSSNLLQQISLLMHKHRADESYRISDLAEDLKISRAQLHRKVKELTGKSCTAFIRESKLQEAFDMLQNNSKSVTEVAFEVGFNNLSYFARSFRKKYNINPSEVSKNH